MVVIFLFLFLATPVFAVQEVVATDLNVALTSPATTLVINGTMDQLVVNTGNVVITMSAGAFPVTITSAARYIFVVSGISDPGTSCGSPNSTLVLPAQGSSIAVTVTPGPSLCVTGSPGGGDSTTTTEDTTTTTTTDTEVSISTDSSGTTTLTTSEGTTAKVDVSADTVSETTTFKITSESVSTVSASTPPPFGTSFIGESIYDYTAALIDGTAVTTFSKDVTITLTYIDAQILSFDENNFAIYFYNKIALEWQGLSTTVDAANNMLVASINHFTRFAIVSSADITPPLGPSNITAVENVSGGIDLSWTNPVKDFRHIKIYRSTVSGELGGAIFNDIFETSQFDLDTVSGIIYYYTIRAVDPAGNESVNTAQVSTTSSVTGILDGDLISTDDSFDIYIVSFVGEKKFKRLILNPTIFESYGHLEWGNVKTVSQDVQDTFTLSDLVIEINKDGSVADPRVYRVSSAPDSDVGQKQWLNMTAAQFEAEGYDWDSLAKINHTEASDNFYPVGLEIVSAL